jgi:hypothetical protein
MSTPIEVTLNSLIQEANGLGKRAIAEDRPELVLAAYDLVRLANRVSIAFRVASPVDPQAYITELKKRFLLSTSLKIVPGIFSDASVAAPIDPTPIRHNSTLRLGVGLVEYRQEKVLIDAPCYRPDNPHYGFIVPGKPLDEWFMVRESGDLSYVMRLEHGWIRCAGMDMVIVREVIGVGRDALGMAAESCPELSRWLVRARDAFFIRYARLPAETARRGIPGFYHFGKSGFCRQPWDPVEVYTYL